MNDRKKITRQIRKLLREFTAQDKLISERRSTYFADLPADLQKISAKLTRIDFAILDTLNEEVQLAKQLVAELQQDATQSAISKSLARLERLGLIERTKLPGNNKEVHITKTSAGKAISKRRQAYLGEMSRRIDGVSAHFDDKQLTDIRDFLAEIVQVMEEDN